MPDPQVPGYTSIANPSGAFGETVQTPNNLDQFTLAETPPGGVYAASVLADAPTIYWPINESSGTTIHDLSGNGFNGTLVPGSGSLGAPGPFVNDPAQTSLLSKGSIITAAGYTVPPGGWTAVTLELWVNFMGAIAATNNGNRVAAIGHPDSLNNGIEFWVPGAVSNVELRAGNGTTAIQLVPTLNATTLTTATLNGWHHYVFTYSGTTGTLYMDGVLVSQLTLTGPITSETSRFAVAGLYLAAASNQFYGEIAQVSYWANKALSAARVLAHYQAGAYV